LKDHLGNTRVSFTTEDRVTDYKGYFEDNTFTNDTTYFYNTELNRVAYPVGGKVQRLNNAAPVLYLAG